jgi:HlyD family secretion protein
VAEAAAPSQRLELPSLAKRRRSMRLAVALVVLAAAGVGAYFALRPTVVPPSFRWVHVERRDVLQVVEATGRVDVWTRYQVPAPMQSYLVDIRAQPRDRVKQGDTLARLDDRQATIEQITKGAAVRAARAGENQARTKLSDARRLLATKQSNLEAGLASRAEVDAATSAVAEAEAALAGARAQVAAAVGLESGAELGRALTEIKAPVDGVVLTAPETLGEAVSPQGPPLFVIADSLDELKITASVDEADVGLVRVGQSATFEVRTFPNRKFHAIVDSIGLEPVRGERLVSYPVLLRAENPDAALLPGMTATVSIEVGRRTGALAVREAALRFVPEGAPPSPARSVLWRKVSKTKIEPVHVEVGLSDGTYTEIEAVEGEEISEGDAIAVGLARARGVGKRRPSLKLGGR